MIESTDVLKLVGGIIYLVLGGDLLVRGAISLARRSQISPGLIGLTIKLWLEFRSKRQAS